MKNRLPDPGSDDRLERLLDEELRAATQAGPVDLRAKVLEAIDEVPSAGFRVQSAGCRVPSAGFRVPSAGFRVPGFALAFAAAAVLVLAVLLTWRGSIGPVPERAAANRRPLASTPLAAGPLVEPAAAPGGAHPDVAGVRSRRASRTANRGPEPVEPDPSLASSGDAYLPGAPAGDLGDPLRPMPSPPPIAFTPIASAPPVSDFARPVTDFPADNPASAVPSGAAGPSGGTRR
jgi:hypothetical protein